MVQYLLSGRNHSKKNSNEIEYHRYIKIQHPFLERNHSRENSSKSFETLNFRINIDIKNFSDVNLFRAFLCTLCCSIKKIFRLFECCLQSSSKSNCQINIWISVSTLTWKAFQRRMVADFLYALYSVALRTIFRTIWLILIYIYMYINLYYKIKGLFCIFFNSKVISCIF